MARTPGRISLPLLLAAAVGLGLGFSGCGVKGPPVPPRQPPLPAVTDLHCRVARQTAALTWRLAEPPPATWYRDWAFGIYRYRTRLDQPPCDGCPQVFDKVATVPYIDTDDLRFSTEVPLDPGYRYVFKVRLETKRRTGPDSNTVQFNDLPAASAQPSEIP
jgi:hypothetical protein